MDAIEKTCVRCGTTFTTMYPRQKYCCKLCSHDANVERSRRLSKEYYEQTKHKKRNKTRQTYTMICPGCNKEFTCQSRGRVFCSRECYKRYTYINVTHTIKCKYCGNYFESHYKAKKYCSDECSNAAKSEQFIEQYNKETKTHFAQLCWTCERACGLCPWSDGSFTPIEGWEAEPSDKIYNGVRGWKIHNCPMYIAEPLRRNRHAR